VQTVVVLHRGVYSVEEVGAGGKQCETASG
jgi:hypothetical protein